MFFLKIENATPGMILGKTLMSREGRVLLHAGVELKPAYIEKIMGHGFAGIYIDDEFSKEIEVEDVIPPPVREVMVEDVKKIFKELEKGKLRLLSAVADNMKKTVYDIINSIIDSDGVVGNIVDLKNHDEYTFRHSVNVTVISIVLGKALGFGRDKLMNLGMSALFHDVGKTKVPLEILNKPGRLTPEEFDEIKKHSRYGCDFVKAHLYLPAIVHVSVLEHHEKYNGEGYPDGISGNTITKFARIIAVADVYDAVTSKRPYSEPMEPADAYDLIVSSSSTHFDPDIVRVFSRTIAPYPVGSVVTLSDGRMGIVTENYEGLITRPLIKILPAFAESGEPSYADLKNDLSLINITIVGME